MPEPKQTTREYYVDTLEESTRTYWELSRQYHLQEGLLTVGGAIKTLREILSNTGPQRKLNILAREIQDTIITGGK